MSKLRLNLMASFAGRGWASILQLALVPVYLHLLGVASYALIGFYTVLYSVVVRLDVGLSTTLNRELARMRGATSRGYPKAARSLLRTLEIVYVGVAVAVGIGVALSAPFLSRHWLRDSTLGEASVRQAVMVMGLVVAVQWPVSLYEGGLRGLERQVLLNIVNGVAATIRGLGAVSVLMFVSRTIVAYFIWQAIAIGLQVAALSIATWHCMPAFANRSRFQWAELRRIGRFTLGIGGISVLSLALTQSDKILLSHLLPLDRFGYYMVASNIAGGLLIVASPLFEAVFPRLSALYADGDSDALRRTYHAAIQLSSMLVLPIAAILVGFSSGVALLWLRDPIAASRTHLLIALLAVGTTANVLMTVPFALQLAGGWTSLSLYKNLIALAVAIPLLIVGVSKWGEVGGAITWIVVNVGYLVFELPYMHRRLLPGALRAVYLTDIGRPLVSVALALWAAAFITRATSSGSGASVAAAFVVATLAALIASPLGRSQLEAFFAARRRIAVTSPP